MNIDKIKKYIDEYEYNQNTCYGRLSGISIKIVNLKVGKTHATADVIVCEDESGNKQRYNKCEYPLEFITQDFIFPETH